MRLLTDGKRHLICVPYSIPNLHKMAGLMCLGRHWFHKDHYDIPVGRKKEIERLCERVSSREIVRIARHGGQ